MLSRSNRCIHSRPRVQLQALVSQVGQYFQSICVVPFNLRAEVWVHHRRVIMNLEIEGFNAGDDLWIELVYEVRLHDLVVNILNAITA